MSFINLPIPELRDITKRNIETLELWLRRVVNDALTSAYGAEYWTHQREDGCYVVNSGIRKKIDDWYNNNKSGRYSRWIDASLIEHLAEIICNSILYNKHFRYYFEEYFPKNFSLDSSRQYLGFIFHVCIDVRNRLSHSNPISARQAEKIACYSNDIIDALKHYYVEHNMKNEFNAPSIIKYSDSFGREIFGENLSISDNKIIDASASILRSGDEMRMSLDIDSSFDENEYSVEWTKGLLTVIGDGREILIKLDESFVAESIFIVATIKTKKSWHRYRHYDDQLQIRLKVLPPLT